ncbi:hypothetical protein AN639_11775 [Candidatus Epulonipiscium fishelsonii]|uniref:Uncharacterized protein n=1 Tax=Candidatus Epulonipiscium fishelsonii TaxID=77094 RepID=A0ACC8XDF2_9FIRM|nr:hypothetical protein AN396_05330 [Epulopiscium sp. SCG-B11WGA-EpuloA1]ONI42949.1 hypothetical protein AN639_11775 [Epulopiscium sp. SCG-B05WGA-EpuloA1]
MTTDRKIESLTKTAQIACKLFLEECKKQNVYIFITETYRSQERQNYLYGIGRTHSLNKKKVTWTKKSVHTNKMAWDIAVSPPNKLYDTKILEQAGSIAKQLNITWGGDWQVVDSVHFQVNKDWKIPMQSKCIPTQNQCTWGQEEINQAMKLNLTTGERLEDYITRKEAIILITRAYNILKKS